jgi:hypothetical protein
LIGAASILGAGIALLYLATLAAGPALLMTFSGRVPRLARLAWSAPGWLQWAVVSATSNRHVLPVVLSLAAWPIYLLFLWRARDGAGVPSHTGRQRLWRSIVALALVVPPAVALVNARVQDVGFNSPRDIKWPFGDSEATSLQLRLPPRYFLNEAVPGRNSISTRVLWPSLATLDGSNGAAFEGFADDIINVDVKGIARRRIADHASDALACEFELVTNESAADCQLTPPVAPTPKFELLPEQDGLSHLVRIIPAGREDPMPVDVWFKRESGHLSTLITCTREGYGSEHTTCVHYFEVAPLNAIVELRYNRKYLKQWQDIQGRLSSGLLAMQRASDRGTRTSE